SQQARLAWSAAAPYTHRRVRLTRLSGGTMSKIAFIGLGNMGAPMAANLVKAGHSVMGFDLADAAKTAAAASGVTIAASAGEAVANADTVVTMLPAGRHVLAAHAELLR